MNELTAFKFVLYVKGERGVSSLSGLLARELRPVLCVSENENETIFDLCQEASISFTTEATPRKPEHIHYVHALKPDLLVCAGYSKILPEALFAPFPCGGINCHGGRLPQYRGASPIPWQIINGESQGTAYLLTLTPGIDDGPILAQEHYSIGPDETAREVTDKVTAIFERIVPDVVEQFAHGGKLEGIPQSKEGACHWTRRYPEDGILRWDCLTAQQAVNQIRALDDPYPGAFIMQKGEKVVLSRARVYGRRMAGVPGRYVGKTPDGALILASNGAVEVLEFKRNGKRLAGTLLEARYGETFLPGFCR